MADELIPERRTPDQSLELTNEAIDFVKAIFISLDNDGDGALQPRELEELFSTATSCPFDQSPYTDAVEKNASGGLSCDVFLSQWALMTLLNPASTIENLRYLGYPSDVSSPIRVTEGRFSGRKSDKNVLQCFVFGQKKAGKCTLLDSFIGRPYCSNYYPTTEDRFAVIVVDQHEGTKKTPSSGSKIFVYESGEIFVVK